MSALIVSALAAATFAAVPPSFGSEPYVFGFDEAAPPARTQVTARAPTLATSLGSEPFLAGSENMKSPRSAGERRVAHHAGAVTLATSLGSEPFLFIQGGSDEVPTAGHAGSHHARELGSPERVARNCTCK